METNDIDWATGNFYKSLCFTNRTGIDAASLKSLFYQDGIMVNNSFKDPITFTVESFIQAMESLVAAERLSQFMQREIYAKTDCFGKVAQRVSIYEYNFADHEPEHLPRGVAYTQFVQVEGLWKITSMVWADENENHLITASMLGGAIPPIG